MEILSVIITLALFGVALFLLMIWVSDNSVDRAETINFLEDTWKSAVEDCRNRPLEEIPEGKQLLYKDLKIAISENNKEKIDETFEKLWNYNKGEK